MFGYKVESDKKELEIVYDVQWKTPGNDDDKAKIIGIVDTSDTNLDWNTFKSYLIQNSGNMRFTTDDIRISYLDSDDDLIPIDSELEFRECLKFSRIRARRGHKIMMKVNMVSNNGAKPKDTLKVNEESSSKNSSPKLFCLKKKDMNIKMMKKPKEDLEDEDHLPNWFEKYMAKFKAELVQEITTAVVSNIRTVINGDSVPGGSAPHHRVRTMADAAASTAPVFAKGHHVHLIEKRKKKKKMPEEDSSDCTDGLQLQWEERVELLRHMQKINKREKKFEKKLDAKLEKLESKTKKIMEKKHSLWNTKKSGTFIPPTAPLSAPASCDLVMDASPVDEYNYVPHVFRGDLVNQVWKVINDGQLPWTDETELRFAWGSKSLVPLTTVVKCPLLKPGETGKVKVSLRAPMFPGNFESYWHFHHQGRRFGHWLGCTVIVDPDPRPDTPPYEADVSLQQQCDLYVDQGPLPVDLTMKCQQNYDDRTSTTDDMKIYNIETKPETMEPSAETPKTQEEICIDTELEEFPRLESYPGLVKSETIVDSFPDLVQHNDDSAMTKPDLNSWAQYIPHGSSENVSVLLSVKDSTDVSLKNENLSGNLEQQCEPASDSDNISIISGAVSVDTDTEPSDEFVVIRMPKCANCDHPLEKVPVTLPITVEIPDADAAHGVQASDNNNNMEQFPNPGMEIPNEVPNEIPNDAPEVKEEQRSDDENTVYIRDGSGKAIPVAKVVRTGIRHSTFGDPNFAHGPNGPRFPFSNDINSPPHCHNPVGPCNFRPQHESPVCSFEVHQSRSGDTFCSHFCHEKQNQNQKFVQQKVPRPPQKFYPCDALYQRQEMSAQFHNIHTEQPRACNYSFNSSAKPNVSETRSSSGSETRDASPVAAAVQILPETLVTGAVNVASSAINTARSVIDMLRPRHEEPIPAMEKSLNVLSEMGFKNRELNIMLLSQHNNDVARVISELVQ